MTRSRRRKLSRERAKTLGTIVRSGVPLASALIAAIPAARAQQASGGADQLQTIVVTAQKIQQNLQNVPISVEVFDNRKLTQLSIVNLSDYVEFAPTMSFVPSQGEGGNGGPGNELIYIRGVVSGGDGNHSGSEPSVAVYLDEEPITTITGAVPLHLYDINRIEILEGPQGTLFGASSEAGNVRIITNKPDPTKFAAGYHVQGNKVESGGLGDTVEGYVNLPITNKAAIRLVAWQEHDGGYISNVAGTDANGCIFNGIRTFPTWALQQSGVGPGGGANQCAPASTPIGAGAITNAPWRKNNYNTVDTTGGRAELRFDLGDNWTVTPTVQGQTVKTNGFFAYDPAMGYLQLAHFGPENSRDTWVQSALTIEGKISDFDIVYAGGYLKRSQYSVADYSDYSEFYDKVNGSGAYYTNNAGQAVMPQQFVIGGGYFEMWNQELRVTTPLDLPVHATVGVFLNRQMHNIWQLYTMPGYGWTNVNGGGNPNGLGSDFSVPGFPNAIWLTDEQRVDRDQAAFAQATWDITQHWSLTGGFRFYKYDNSLIGFYGFNKNFFGGEGTGTCILGIPAVVKNSPCTDLDARTSNTGSVPKANLTWKITPDKMVYATYSKGFRPGGVNRIGGTHPLPYSADFLSNYEVGWKTQWLGDTLRWNGAFFWEDWKDFQFSFLGPNSVTEIANAGNARIKGMETSIDWLPVSNLLLSTDFTFLDPVLTQSYYGCIVGVSCPTPLPAPEAPAGTNLPVTPKFKGNLIIRYSLQTVGNWKPYLQLSGMYQTTTTPVLRVDQGATLGRMPAYAMMNFKIGADSANGMHLDLFINNLANREAQLTRFTESNPSLDSQVYIEPAQPRTFGIEFGQDF